MRHAESDSHIQHDVTRTRKNERLVRWLIHCHLILFFFLLYMFSFRLSFHYLFYESSSFLDCQPTEKRNATSLLQICPKTAKRHNTFSLGRSCIRRTGNVGYTKESLLS